MGNNVLDKIILVKSFDEFKDEENEGVLSNYITLCAVIKEIDGKRIKELVSEKIKSDAKKKKEKKLIKSLTQHLGGDALNLTPYKFVEGIITTGLETPPMKKLLRGVINDSLGKKWYLKIKDIAAEDIRIIDEESDVLKVTVDFEITNYTKLINKIKRKIKIKGKEEYTKLISESIDIWNSEVSEEVKKKAVYYALTSSVLSKMINELQDQILDVIKTVAAKKGDLKLEIQRIDLGIRKNL